MSSWWPTRTTTEGTKKAKPPIFSDNKPAPDAQTHRGVGLPVSSERVDGLHIQSSAPEKGAFVKPIKTPNKQSAKERPVSSLSSLLGGRRLLEVPQLEGLVLGGRDQDRLHRVEGQAAHRVEVAPQGELGVPGFPQSVFVIGDLGEGGGGACIYYPCDDEAFTFTLSRKKKSSY